MANFDAILNIAIPIGIVLFFGFLMYDKLREPLGRFVDWIKSLFEKGKEKMEEGKQYAIEYEPREKIFRKW